MICTLRGVYEEREIVPGIYINLHLKFTKRRPFPTLVIRRAFSVNAIRIKCNIDPFRPRENSIFFPPFFYSRDERYFFCGILTRKERRVVRVRTRIYLPHWRKCNKYFSRHARAGTRHRVDVSPILPSAAPLSSEFNERSAVSAVSFSFNNRLVFLFIQRWKNRGVRVRMLSTYAERTI